MATLQRGKWSLVLRESSEYTAPLVLQRDLRVTRATLAASGGNQSAWPCCKVNGGKEEALCDWLGNGNGRPLGLDLDKLFPMGDSVQFEAYWWQCPSGTIKLQGHFETTNETLGKQLTVAECNVVGQLETTRKQLTEEITAVRNQMTRHTESTAEQSASTQALIREQMTNDKRIADLIDKHITRTKSLIDARMASLQERTDAQTTLTKQHVTDQAIDTKAQLTVEAANTKDQLSKELTETKHHLTEQLTATTARLDEVSDSVQEMTAAVAEQTKQVTYTMEQMSQVTATVKDMADEMVKKVRQTVQLWQADFVGKKVKEERDVLRVKYATVKEKYEQMKVYVESLERTERNHNAIFDKLKARGVVINDL